MAKYKDGMYGEMAMKGRSQGDMKPYVKDCAKPPAVYAEKYDQAPLDYIERNNTRQSKAGNKLRSESFMGRYDKY